MPYRLIRGGIVSHSDKKIILYDTDMAQQYLNYASNAGIVAWDTETTGLNWREDRTAICQLYAPGGPVAIVRIGKKSPIKLRSLLSDPSIKKVFHNAMFDLLFMCYNWNVIPQNIACTKIASKLLNKSARGKEHTLKWLLKKNLGVQISKTERLSNWLSKELSSEQLAYAVGDVIYLLPLLDVLESKLESKGLLELARACFQHIPTRVQLNIKGYADPYTY
jgi:ribonuclease D